jgi:hypothetical protein
MGHCLYSFSSSRGLFSPYVSGNVTSVCSAPPPFAGRHDGTEQPANLHSGFLETRGGDPPASATPGLDVVTCQWADCRASFDDLNMFICHVHKGASCLLVFGSPTLLKRLDFPLPP